MDTIDLDIITPEFFKDIDPRTFKCEEVYRELELKLNQTEQEKIAFISMKSMRDSFITYNDIFTSCFIYYDWDGQSILPWEAMFKRAYLSSHLGKDLIGKFLVSTV